MISGSGNITKWMHSATSSSFVIRSQNSPVRGSPFMYLQVCEETLLQSARFLKGEWEAGSSVFRLLLSGSIEPAPRLDLRGTLSLTLKYSFLTVRNSCFEMSLEYFKLDGNNQEHY